MGKMSWATLDKAGPTLEQNRLVTANIGGQLQVVGNVLWTRPHEGPFKNNQVLGSRTDSVILSLVVRE